MTGQNNRYITLDGYSLHKPLRETFFESAAVRTIAGLTASAAATDFVVRGGQDMKVIGAIIVTAIALHAYDLTTDFRNSICFGRHHNKLAIDTYPTGSGVTSPENLLGAIRMKKMAVKGIPITCLATGLTAAGIGWAFGSTLVALGGMLSCTPQVVRAVSCALRFDKVMNGEYVIVDAPPKPVEQAESVRQARVAYSPT